MTACSDLSWSRARLLWWNEPKVISLHSELLSLDSFFLHLPPLSPGVVYSGFVFKLLPVRASSLTSPHCLGWPCESMPRCFDALMEALGVAVESEETKVTKVCTAGSLCFPCRSGLESRSNCTDCSVSQQIGVRHSVTNPSGNLELQHIYIYIICTWYNFT